MAYVLRDYQQQASDAAVNFFHTKNKRNGLLVVPTGGGKSLVIADIATRLDGDLLVFQPSKEILEQNYAKLRSYGVEDCSIYSASFNSKKISRITFATIGSVKAHMEDFNHFKYILVDEAHCTNAQGGMYKDFFDCAERKILGLTATPYRLSATSISLDENGRYDPTCEPQNRCILKFLTRTRPRIFHDVIYQVDISTLLQRGYLARMRYFDMSVIEQGGLKRNTTGMDYDDEYLIEEYKRVSLQDYLVSIINRLLNPKSGQQRKGILVFTKFLEESEYLARQIDGCAIVSGTTPKKEREAILKDFKAGRIRVVSNVGVLTTGFDYPELDTVVMARPTMSLALYYQICIDMETEILTKRGFMSYSKIRQTDEVAAFDKGRIVWVPIQSITHRNVYPGERMVSYKNQHIDFRVTEDHDLLICNRGSDIYFKEKAIKVAQRKSSVLVPVSGIQDVKGINLTDDEIRFIGYVLSDGSVSKHNNSVIIVQSLRYPHLISKIEKTLQNCNFRYGKCLQKRKGKETKYFDTYHFSVSHGMPRKKADRDAGLRGWADLEPYINGCKIWNDKYEDFSEHQFDVLINAINDGDGAKHYGCDYTPRTMTICMGINKEYAEAMMSLAIRRGYRCGMSIYNTNRTNPIYMLRLKKTNHSNLNGLNIDNFERNGYWSVRENCKVESANPKEEVWCVSNSIGTIITRRNGKVAIMGNCGRAIRPHPSKNESWFVDLCGNIKKFGRVEDLHLSEPRPGEYVIQGYAQGQWRALTNVYF